MKNLCIHNVSIHTDSFEKIRIKTKRIFKKKGLFKHKGLNVTLNVLERKKAKSDSLTVSEFL